jgi:hypothetical protein
LNCFVCAPTANLAKWSFSFLRGKNKKKWDLSKFHLFIIRFLDFGESKMLKGQAWEMMGACRNSFQVSGKPGNTNGYNLRKPGNTNGYNLWVGLLLFCEQMALTRGLDRGMSIFSVLREGADVNQVNRQFHRLSHICFNHN